ncbi:hypothetical protein WH5701_16465 [Synechococcus sp. WH 5701]|nr:hypothetical protein WH5701_16465 [Synechococcus sp. WH 5701]
MLNSDVISLIRGNLNKEQFEVINGTTVVNDQLNTFIASIDASPHEQASFCHQMVGQAGITFGKHNRFTTTGEIFKLQNGHPIAFSRRDLTQFSDHRDRADLGFIRLLLQGTQANGCQQTR